MSQKNKKQKVWPLKRSKPVSWWCCRSLQVWYKMMYLLFQGLIIHYNLQHFEISVILPSFITPITRLLYTLSCSVDLDWSSSGVLSDAGGGVAAAAAGASTSGTFSFTGEAGSVVAVLAVAGGSSTDVEVGGGPPLKHWAISSKVFPLVSGTLRKVKMKKMMRKAQKMRKTQGPHKSWGERRGVRVL